MWEKCVDVMDAPFLIHDDQWWNMVESLSGHFDGQTNFAYGTAANFMNDISQFLKSVFTTNDEQLLLNKIQKEI